MARRFLIRGSVLVVAMGIGVVLAGRVSRGEPDVAGGPPVGPGGQALAPATTTIPSPQSLALGKRTYEKLCVACHGVTGKGDGEAAHFLSPRPRDFTTGKYALVSTWERVPTDEDLYETILRGMPGSGMPPVGQLSREERWGLVHYIKTFAEKPWVVQPATDPEAGGGAGTGVIRVPPEPPFTLEARARALELYADACAGCHGNTGKGDGQQEMKDDKGFATRPRDLTLGVFKGGPDPKDLYRRIVAGMPGTPMPMNDWAYGNDAWHLSHLIRSWSSPEQRARAEMR